MGGLQPSALLIVFPSMLTTANLIVRLNSMSQGWSVQGRTKRTSLFTFSSRAFLTLQILC